MFIIIMLPTASISLLIMSYIFNVKGDLNCDTRPNVYSFRSANLSDNCNMYLRVFCMLNCENPSNENEKYLIYRRPIPALVLAASLRSPDGDDLGCSRLLKPKWLWRGRASTVENFQLPPTLLAHRSHIRLLKRYLPNDNITMEVTATVGERVYVDQIAIVVVPSPIMASIDGGAMRSISRRHPLKLDASGSHDPDERLDMTTMRFIWYCKAYHKESLKRLETDLKNVEFEIPAINVTVIITENQCPPGKDKRQCRPYFKTNSNGELECLGFKEPFTNSEDPVVIVNPDLMSSSYSYIFRVIVTSKTDSEYPQSTALQEIYIDDQMDTPGIAIKCVYNCFNNQLNYMERLIMILIGKMHDSEEWEIERLSTDNTTLASNVKSPWTNSYFPRSNRFLYLLPQTFPPAVHIAVKRNVAVANRRVVASMVSLRTIEYKSLLDLTETKCSILPNTGFTLFTLFTLNCGSIESLVDLEIYQHTNTNSGRQIILVAYGSMAMAHQMYLARGDNYDNYKSQIVVRLIVSNYIHHDVHLNVQVMPLVESELCSRNVELISCLNENFVKLPRRHLQWLMAKGHITEAIAGWNIIGHLMNNNQTTKLKLEMRDQMSFILNDLPIVETSSVLQAMMAIEAVFNSSDSAYSLLLQNRTLKAILDITDRLYDLCYEYKPNFRFVVDAAKHSAYATSALFQVALQQRRWVQQAKHNLTSMFNVNNLTKQGVVSMRLMNNIWNKIGRVLLKHEITDAAKHSVSTSLFQSEFSRVTFHTMSNSSLIFGMKRHQSPLSSYVEFPFNNTRFSRSTFDVYLIKYLRHPLAELPSVPHLKKSQAISFQVIDSSTDAIINQFQPPINIMIHTSHILNLDNKFVIEMKPFESHTDSDIFVLRFKVPQLPYPASIFLAIASNYSGPKFHIVTSKRRRPSLADFKRPSNQFFSGLAWSTANKPSFSKNKNADKKMTSLLPNTEQVNDHLYFGLLSTAANGSSQSQSVSIKADILAITCLRLSDKGDKWFTTGCQPVVSVGNNNPQLINCRCSHLSTITACNSRLAFNHDRYKPFKFKMTVPFNPTILYFLLALILLLALLFLLGFIINRKSHYGRGVTLIKDNDPTHRYAYLLTVHTSNRLMSFTSSCIAVKLSGTLSDSPFHHLSDRCRTQFKTGSQDTFLILSEASLGVIQGISVIVTASGSSPNWYLNQIRVYNLQTQQSWKFEAKKRVKLKKNEQATFKLTGKVFTSKEMDRQYSYKERLLQRFNEDYIYFNFLHNSRITHFNYAKRIICIVILILLALFINLLLRGVPSCSPIEHIGPPKFIVMKWDIIWAFVTAAILLVFNLIIVFASTQTVMQHKQWQIFIDHDENWTQINYDIDIDIYEVPLGDQMLIITLSPHDHSHMHDYEQSKTFKPIKCDVCRQNAWCFFTVAAISIIALIILNVIYGLRYSVVRSLQWIFSSMIGFLVCALILYPLALIILTTFLKAITNDKYTNRRKLIGSLINAFNARQQEIEKKGSLAEYNEYLRKLRQICIYRPIHVKKSDKES